MNNTNANKMKSKELRKIIREAILEVLSETTYAGKESIDNIKRDPKYNSLTQTAKTNVVNDLNKGNDVKLDEMARIAKGYKLTNDNVDTSRFTKRISGVSLADVIEYFRENPGAEKKSLQSHFNFARPQIANAIVNGLMDAGVLTKLGAGGEEEAPETQAQAPAATDAEDMFIGGSGDILSMYFDDKPNADGSEDFNDDEEPTIDDLEPAEKRPSRPSTDKEKADNFTIDDANSRLITSIINNYTTLKSRTRGSGEVGGLSGSDMMKAIRSSKAAAELRFPQKIQQLVDKIKEQEPSVQKAILDLLTFKFASVKLPSLAKLIAKELNLDVKIPVIKSPIEEPVEKDEEEAIDEALLAEYKMRKLQYYAGIIK
jgi:hypothetical protein